MSKLGKVMKASVVVGGAVAASIFWGWLASRESLTTSEPVDEQSNYAELPVDVPYSKKTSPAEAPFEVGTLGFNQSPAALRTQAPELVTNWEARVAEILTSDGEDAEKGKEMLELFLNISQDGQVEAAQHLSNFLPNSEYAMLGQYLTNPATPEPVL